MGEELRAQVLERLRTPSSPLCPLAVPLGLSIRKAVGQVEEVTGQEIEVVGYVGAAELNAMLRELESE